MRPGCASLRTWLGALLAAASLVAAPRDAVAAPGNWIVQHGIAELTIGPEWRVALADDSRVPGFSTVTMGGELVLGAEILAGLGVVAAGRFRYGGTSLTGGGTSYAEAGASLGLQYRAFDRLRARLMADLGEAFLQSEQPLLVGAALELSLDVVPLGRGALSFTLRIDAESVINPPNGFPNATLSLATGLGGRY